MSAPPPLATVLRGMRITLVRHGETTGQSSFRYYGATDVPLSDLGCEQMRRVREALAGEVFDAVFSSRLRRSREAAALIADGRAAVTAMAEFDEVNFGRWEGWTREEIAARDPEQYRAWQQNGGDFSYPDGESRPAFGARVARGLSLVFNDHRPENALMVLHRGVIGNILAELLQLPPAARARLAIDLASIHVVRIQNGCWGAEALNRVDHLLGMDAGGVRP